MADNLPCASCHYRRRGPRSSLNDRVPGTICTTGHREAGQKRSLNIKIEISSLTSREKALRRVQIIIMMMELAVVRFKKWIYAGWL